MKLNNPFPAWVRELWRDHFWCAVCGETGQLELHHITGRDSCAAVNGVVICPDCHRTVGHTNEEEKQFFIYTFSWLQGLGYQLRDNDFDYLAAHPYLIAGEEMEADVVHYCAAKSSM